ncbi:MAG: B12-binding domain-containing radical SAM protein [Nanoarchaeota archaeon]|nr:B12-binding domain-containing radical SAM protein [Nanoarchaeota archaeon]MBU1321062.1 B12-binding domain-containing radical SAM protein [Nanoarchaeota archaeon]MBU1597068.1 B12-binding domain-containing radical SAM protein [Nanoarchaeota archaeon]MBU2440858.1 B12-binding domain-containing radical SAM protein [Nanoarchaeota archaeon]
MKIQKKFRVLLINPPPENLFKEEDVSKQSQISITPPLGLAYIAAYLLKNKSYDVSILDAHTEGVYEMKINDAKNNYGIFYDIIREKIEEYKPDLVGVSCLIVSNRKQAHKVCEIIKSVNKSIITVMGGGYPTTLPEKAMSDHNVNYVILGEGEHSFFELVESIKSNKSVDYIDGISYRLNDSIKINPKTKYIEDLDSLPFPDRSLLPMEKYFEVSMPIGANLTSRFTSFLTSRGCPANCIFCSSYNIWGKKFRARSAKNILDEIDLLIRKYDIGEIQFIDDNLTFNIKRAEEIFDGIIERKFNLILSAPNGIALYRLSPKLISKMKKCGFNRVCLGIESGDQYVLDHIIKKPLNLEKIKPLIKIMKEEGLYLFGFFMFGFPGETKEQMYNTIKFAMDSGLDWCGNSIANPLPGTQMYKICEEKNYFKGGGKDLIFDEINYSKGNIKTEDFTQEDVEEISYDANLRINFLNNPNLKRNIDLALMDFSRVAERYHGHAIARYSLGKAYYLKKEYAKAQAEWKKVLKLHQTSDDAKKCLDKYHINIKSDLQKVSKKCLVKE